jgi:WD40 repeat protein
VRSLVVRDDGRRLAANGVEWEIGAGGMRPIGSCPSPDFGTIADGQRREVLAASADGHRAAVGVWPRDKVDGRVELWDSAAGRRIAVLDAAIRPWPDGGGAFSPDGRLLVVRELHVKNDLIVFEAEAGKYLRTIPIKVRQRAFAFASPRQTISVGSGVVIANLDSGRLVRSWAAGTMETQDRVVAAAAGMIATAGEDRMIHLWDMEGREITRWTAHAADVTALAFDTPGQVLYSGAEDGSLRAWDLERMRAEAAKLGVSW